MAEESGLQTSSLSGFNVALIVLILFISLLTSYILSASYIIWRVEGIWRLPFGASAFKSLWAAITTFRIPKWMSSNRSPKIFYKNIDQEMIIIDAVIGDHDDPISMSPYAAGERSRKSSCASRHSVSSLESFAGVGILSRVSTSPLVRLSPHDSGISGSLIQIINITERMEIGEMKCGSPLPPVSSTGSLGDDDSVIAAAEGTRRKSIPLNSGLLRIKRSIQAARHFMSPKKFWDWEPMANNDSDSAYSMPATLSNSFFAIRSPADPSAVSLLQVAKSWDEERSRRRQNYSTFSVDAY